LTFLFKKTLSTAKYEYAKIQRKILLEDALEDAVAMIFIDFGLLRSAYCNISYYYLLKIGWLVEQGLTSHSTQFRSFAEEH